MIKIDDLLIMEDHMHFQKKALITGITGQDGSYLAEFLLKKNYKVSIDTEETNCIKLFVCIHLYCPKV